MEQEELCELQASDGVMSRDENGLFRKLVYHDWNSMASLVWGAVSAVHRVYGMVS